MSCQCYQIGGAFIGADPDCPVHGNEAVSSEEQINELRSALSAALEWIDAIPKEVAAKLPTMPGFDRDWANSLIGK